MGIAYTKLMADEVDAQLTYEVIMGLAWVLGGAVTFFSVVHMLSRF